MVDFNNETTVGTPAVDVVRILILQRRADVIEAIELYNKNDFSGISPNLAMLKSRLFSLFLEIQGSLKRKMKLPEYEKLLNDIQTGDIETIKNSFYFINEYLDSINLTKIDTKKEYDRSSFETDNKAQGIR